MKTAGIIEGLIILQKYHLGDGWNTGAEHDVIYVYSNIGPIELNDLKRLVELGWRQHEVDTGEEEFAVKDYNADEGWSCWL